MKTIPPPCPEPESGPKYWRSLDELAGTPEFQDWAEREFPAGASELKDEFTRRNFVKIMSASFLLAGFGLTGCRRPVEKIYPISKLPEGYIHGVANYFATAMPNRSGAIPLVVKSHDGRPVKIEGNDQHPDSNGGTNGFAQASILNLYDPDRAQRFTKPGTNATRAEATDAKPGEVFDELTKTARKLGESGGAGLCILAERSSSPSRARLQAEIATKYPKSRWFVYEPVDFNIHVEAASLATGQSVRPYFKLDQARAILSLDADFIGSEEEDYRLIRGFTKGRKISQPGDTMNRLYVVEALMSQTGANADHRLRIPSSQVIQVAAQIALEVLAQTAAPAGGDLTAALKRLAEGGKSNPKWVTECAKDLATNKGAVLALAGQRQPLAVHLIAHVINSALGSLGKTVEFHAIPETKEEGLAQLVEALQGGLVGTLVMLGGNPAYNAPADLNWAAAQAKAGTVFRLGYYEDESFPAKGWQLPAAHYLEAWGDARTSDGTLVPVQPLIEPLFGGVTELELLARLLGSPVNKPYDIARETFKAGAGPDIFEEKWKRYLHDGYLAGSAVKPVSAVLDFAAAAKEIALASVPVAPGKDKLEVVFHRDYSVDDGRYSNNGWLQEMPDPVTKLVWDNAVLISRKTALDLGVKNNEVVTVELGRGRITGPIWIQPGQAENVIGLALGYGREKSGRIGNYNGGKVGFNVYPLRTTAAMNIAVGAKISATGRTAKLTCTQDHWSMQGRPIIREASLGQFASKPDFAKNMDLDAVSHTAFIPTNPDGTPKGIYQHPYNSSPELKSDVHQWGMSIDLNSCVGCSACVMACQSENNIPIVSKDQVARGREMHWMRIDRYYTGVPPQEMEARLKIPGGTAFAFDEDQYKQAWIDEPQVVNQPMLCQHCESAPCESVCPVNATVHDEEGLNVMAYNRCVGTRYCSNNCAWKVRRFNFFDYNKRPIENLYAGPLATRRQDEFDLLKLVRNPEVTVRMRGVMEKCTFCIQRIESAKITQKVKAGATGNVQVPEGAIKTACQQSCPADAIVFGNLLDPKSRVSQLKKQQRDYAVLGFLNNKPRLTYLAKVRNPNPEMPDAKILSLEEYKGLGSDPFEEHHAAPGHSEKKGGH